MTSPIAGLPVLGRLHMLMIESSQKSREADRKAEEMLDAEERAADAQRLQEMRDKADDALLSGLFSSGLQLANGAAQIVASTSTLSAMKNTEASKQCDPELTRAEKLVEKKESIVNATAKAVDGARTALDAVARSSADHAQARIGGLENQAKAARRAADRLKSEQDAAKQSENRLTQLAAEIAQAQQQCLRAALLRM